MATCGYCKEEIVTLGGCLCGRSMEEKRVKRIKELEEKEGKDQ